MYVFISNHFSFAVDDDYTLASLQQSLSCLLELGDDSVFSLLNFRRDEDELLLLPIG